MRSTWKSATNCKRLAMAGDAPAELYAPSFHFGAEPQPLLGLAEWINGLAFKNIAFTNDGLPVVKIAEIKSGFSDATKRTNGVYDDRVRLRDGDLLFCWSGQPETSIGTFVWDKGDAWLNQHIFRVLPDKAIDPRFFRFLMLYLQPNFQEIARNKQTTGLGHVTKGDLGMMMVQLPLRPEQERIADTLQAIQDKIDLNRQMTATLEETARVLFKSWFVDFEPVRAKVENRDTGLPESIAALFPDKFDQEFLPVGWERRSLYDFTNVVYGAPFSSSRFNSDGVGLPLIRVRDLALHRPTIFTDEEHRVGHVIQPGDIVVGMDGEFRCHVWKGEPAYLNQRVCHFEPLVDIPNSFVALALEAPLARIEQGAVGTTVIHLGKRDLDNIDFIWTSPELMKVFGSLADKLFDRSVEVALESRALEKLRDTLLPKLVSGELRFETTATVIAAA